MCLPGQMPEGKFSNKCTSVLLYLTKVILVKNSFLEISYIHAMMSKSRFLLLLLLLLFFKVIKLNKPIRSFISFLKNVIKCNLC